MVLGRRIVKMDNVRYVVADVITLVYNLSSRLPIECTRWEMFASCVEPGDSEASRGSSGMAMDILGQGSSGEGDNLLWTT